MLGITSSLALSKGLLATALSSCDEDTRSHRQGHHGFVPAQGRYEDAISFYRTIGFEVDFRSDSISIIRKDQCRFFLQNVAWAGARDNFMMCLEVDDLDAWWEMLNALNLSEKFDGVRVRDPQDYPWGKREIHLTDPCGVLWHIAVSID